MRVIRWGIVGCGRIAASFSKGLQAVPDQAQVVAVAARDQARAVTFAQTLATAHPAGGTPRAYGSYAELAADMEVDIVYVAVTTAHHVEVVTALLQAGRHVLCEKPLTTNSADTRALIACAKHHDRFFMEAMWTRFLPIYTTVRQWMDAGKIGKVLGLRGDFSIPECAGKNPRLFERALGGGALLDVGVYPISLAQWLFGPVESVMSQLMVGSHGVDEQGTVCLRHSSGQWSTSCFSIVGEGAHDLHIYGSEGSIRVPGAWWAKSATLVRGYNVDEEATVSGDTPGYTFEAVAAMECLRSGLREHPNMTWSDSQAIADVMETVMAAAGTAYAATGTHGAASTGRKQGAKGTV